MDCLDLNEIIDFVSMRCLDAESVSLAARVNAHICECGECMERVRLIQDLKDELGHLAVETALSRLVSGGDDSSDEQDADGPENS